MNTLTWQDFLKGLQNYICELLPPGQTLKMALPEWQDKETDELENTQAFEDYLFSLSIMLL